MEKLPYFHRVQWHSSLAKLTFWSFVFLGLIFIFFFQSSPSGSLPSDPSRRSLRLSDSGDSAWEKRVRSSAKVRSHNGILVLVTRAARFVGTHVSTALKGKGDGVLGLNNLNDYYDPSLKRAHQALLERTGVYTVEGDNQRFSMVQVVPREGDINVYYLGGSMVFFLEFAYPS